MYSTLVFPIDLQRTHRKIRKEQEISQNKVKFLSFRPEE
jgi:hypothetical protein